MQLNHIDSQDCFDYVEMQVNMQTRKRFEMNKITTIATMVGLGFLASMAQAQDVMLTPQKPFRVAIGTYNPMGSTIRQSMGGTLPMLSLSYDATKSTADKPMIYGAYFDYAQNRRSGTNNSVTAFGVSARYLSQAPVTSSRYFIGGGIGSYDVKVGGSNSKIGGKVFGGYELNNGYFGELTYHIINKIHGDDPSAVAIAIGRRF